MFIPEPMIASTKAMIEAKGSWPFADDPNHPTYPGMTPVQVEAVHQLRKRGELELEYDATGELVVRVPQPKVKP